MRLKHINTLNLKAAFEAFKKGVTLPPGVLAWMRCWQHRQERLARYRMRMASYPYSSKRQETRYARTDMRAQQANSHKPPALWPLHLGPSPHRP